MSNTDELIIRMRALYGYGVVLLIKENDVRVYRGTDKLRSWIACGFKLESQYRRDKLKRIATHLNHNS